MPPSSLDHSKTLQDFEDKLSECTRTAVCGQTYILVDKLQVWLRSQATQTLTHIERQVYAAYKDRSLPNLPIPFHIFDPGKHCCILIFSILRTIGRGDLINYFSEREKTDWKLPLSTDDVGHVFRTAHASNLAADFLEKQYRFCPAAFNFQRSVNWNKGVVIPICSKDLINEDGTTHLWLIDIPEEFIGETLRKESIRSRFNAAPPGADPDWAYLFSLAIGDFTDSTQRYEFALQTFKSKDAKVYENKREACICLKGHEGIIRYLASFKKTELSHASHETGSVTATSTESHNSSNILLEFADMDLSVYFRNRNPPALVKENEEFWKALFAIATAVKDIHNFKDYRGEETRKYNGWHTDIKPDNILIVDDTKAGVCKFKLAAPGLAHFELKDPKSPSVPMRKLSGGTKTYGPPEYPGESEQPVSQAIDIWSLGCVFSVAATWAIMGFVGVLQFNEFRTRAIEEIHRGRPTQSSVAASIDDKPEAGKFHDGNKLLDIVTLWHEYLRGRVRKCDTISAHVLDLIDEKMLITNPRERIEADNLCKRLEELLAQSSEEVVDNVPIRIQNYLEEIDETVSDRLDSMRHSKGIEQGNANGMDEEGSKPRSIELMPKITSRQSILLSDVDQVHQRKEPRCVISLGTAIESPPEATSLPSPHPSQKDETIRGHRSTDSYKLRIVPINSRKAKKPSQHPPQNVFQAREALRNREKKTKRILSKFSPHHQTKNNEVLKNYFGDRDIKFLVDNAESMRRDWEQVTYLLETLVMKAKVQDPDGMDLCFTTGNVNLANKQKASMFVQKMAEGYPRDGVRTNIIESLGTIFDKYLNSLRYTRNQARNVTLIVLTNGAWDGTTNKKHVSEKIVEFLEQLGNQAQTLKYRQFSIEFVQFGDDEDATTRLKHLDNFLRKKRSSEGTNQGPTKYKDMIDIEPADGDVNKMLLGSFVKAYDNNSDDDDDPHTPEDVSGFPSRHRPISPQDELMSPSHRSEGVTYEHETYTPLMSEE